MSPIDYRCRDCGTSFEVGVTSLMSDDYQADCPACDSRDVGTDWDAVVRRFGTPEQADEVSDAAVPAVVHGD